MLPLPLSAATEIAIRILRASGALLSQCDPAAQIVVPVAFCYYWDCNLTAYLHSLPLQADGSYDSCLMEIAIS